MFQHVRICLSSTKKIETSFFENPYKICILLSQSLSDLIGTGTALSPPHTVATLRDCPREDWLATHEDWLATGISTSFWRLQNTEHVRSSVPTSCRLQIAESLHSVRLAKYVTKRDIDIQEDDIKFPLVFFSGIKAEFPLLTCAAVM